MLKSPRPKLALELLDDSGLLEVILPEISACKGVLQSGYHTHDVFGHTLRTVEATPPDLLLRVAALFHDVGKPATAKGDGTFIGHEDVGARIARAALERLRFSVREIEVVVGLVHLHLRPVFYRSEWTDGAVRRLARDAGPLLDRLVALAKADIGNTLYYLGEGAPDPKQRTETWEKSLKDYELSMKLNPQDPDAKYNHEFVKKRLEELVIDGEIAPDRAAVIDYLATHSQL